MRMQIKRAGWLGDSKKDCIVRMSKGDRDSLGISARRLVRVKFGDKEELAVVMPQFTDLLIYPQIVAINSILMAKLGVNVDDEVEVLNNVSQEDSEQYTSQEEFMKRQVIGQLNHSRQKQKATEILASLGLFTEEESSEEGAGEQEEGEQGVDTQDSE